MEVGKTMKPILGYILCKDREEAKKIGGRLLKKRLVVCVNIVENVHSMYLWPPKSGKIEEADEVILLCKTIESKWKAIEKEVVKLHSYKTPEIGAIPFIRMNKKYVDWMKGELL